MAVCTFATAADPAEWAEREWRILATLPFSIFISFLRISGTAPAAFRPRAGRPSDSRGHGNPDPARGPRVAAVPSKTYTVARTGPSSEGRSELGQPGSPLSP